MKMMARAAKSSRQRGFTLLELMISLLLLSIIMGVIVQGINSMQERNAVQSTKVDLTQETREFMDQVTNDLQQSGYPGLYMFDPNTTGLSTNCYADGNVACGFISVSSTAIQFEGDVDGSGVSEEWIQLVQTNGSTTGCTTTPCVIQRGTVNKACYIAGTCSVAYYTEVSGVMNTAIFTASDNTGTPISITTALGSGQMSNIASIGITLYVQAAYPDPQTGLYPNVTMVSTAKVTNRQNY